MLFAQRHLRLVPALLVTMALAACGGSSNAEDIAVTVPGFSETAADNTVDGSPGDAVDTTSVTLLPDVDDPAVQIALEADSVLRIGGVPFAPGGVIEPVAGPAISTWDTVDFGYWSLRDAEIAIGMFKDVDGSDTGVDTNFTAALAAFGMEDADIVNSGKLAGDSRGCNIRIASTGTRDIAGIFVAHSQRAHVPFALIITATDAPLFDLVLSYTNAFCPTPT